jgi:heterodisulfide reductase subunit B
MEDYYYYPGCSLKGAGVSYEKSLLATLNALGITVQELPDWNCCGATSYMAVDEMSAHAMAARNIGIAEKDGKDILAPCSACFAALNKTCHYSEEYPKMKKKLHDALRKVNLPFEGNKQKIQHPLYMLMNEYGLENIEAKLKHKLKGYTVFPYYGCLTSRPFSIEENRIYPVAMDEMMSAIGCEVVDHSLKTRCCGGTLTGTIPEVGLRMVYILLTEAKRKKADVIVTMCPLCQFNLDIYQKAAEKKYKEKIRIPVLYFTQLLGLALGIDPKELGLNHHVVSFKNVQAAL